MSIFVCYRHLQCAHWLHCGWVCVENSISQGELADLTNTQQATRTYRQPADEKT